MSSIKFALLLIVIVTTVKANTLGEDVQIFDQLCDQQFSLFKAALHSREKWALEIFNAWGAVQFNFHENNLYSFGRFSDCVNLRSSVPAYGLVKGQYCLVDFQRKNGNRISEVLGNKSMVQHLTRTLSQGVCIPSYCSNHEVTKLINSLFKNTKIVAIKSECQLSESQIFSTLDLAATAAFLIFGLLLALSTLHDIKQKNSGDKPHWFLCIFSLHANVPNLLHNGDNPKTAVDCILGLRVFSLLFALFSQRYVTQTAMPTTNADDFKNHQNFVFSVIVSSLDMSVDTFFLVGALSTTLSTLTTLDATKKINIPKLMVQRYIKTVPTVAAIVLYSASLSRFLVTGPLGINDKFPFTISVLNKRCQKFWWSALLHIQNFVNPSEMCGDQTWFASLDYQVFIISLFLIYPAWKFGWKFLWILGALAGLTCIYVFKVVSNESEIKLLMVWTKLATLARLGPALVGIILGYVVYNARKEKPTAVASVNIVLWIISLSILASTLVLSKLFPLQNLEVFPLATAIFVSVRRTLWAIGVALMIFLMEVYESGGLIRKLLTLQRWHLLRTLGICMYYVNFVLQMTIVSNMKDVATLEAWSMLHAFCGDVMVAFLLGSMLHLAFEAPAKLFADLLDRK